MGKPLPVVTLEDDELVEAQTELNNKRLAYRERLILQGSLTGDALNRSYEHRITPHTYDLRKRNG